MTNNVLAIDLGTTFSSVAAVAENINEIIEDKSLSEFIPSIVNFKRNKQSNEINVLVGNFAKKVQIRNNTTTVYDTKRMLGRKFDDKNIEYLKKNRWPFNIEESESGEILICLEGIEKKYHPYEISGEILKYLAEIANKRFPVEERTKDVIITIPANFGDEQRTETIKAAEYAGLHVLQLINEPTAAGLAYGLQNQNQTSNTRYVLIFDFGGGTLDVSLLEQQGEKIEVKATDGDMFLGGRDFDENTMNFLIKEYHLDESFCKNTKKMQKLLEDVVDAKIQLSLSTEASISFDTKLNNEEEEYDFLMTLTKFEEINAELINRILIPVERLLESAKMDKSQIDFIIPVGGSSNMQFVPRKLKEFFGKEPYRGVHPQRAVTQGAAIIAKNYVNPSESIQYHDICPKSIGTSDIYGEMNVLIAKGEKIPKNATESFTTIYYRQESFSVDIYEGESPNAKDNTYLGEFCILNLPQTEDFVTFDVTFSIDQSGILNAKAKLSDGDLYGETQINTQKMFSSPNPSINSNNRDDNTIECEIFLQNIQRFINFNKESFLEIYSESTIINFLNDAKNLEDSLGDISIEISDLVLNYTKILSDYFRKNPKPKFFQL